MSKDKDGEIHNIDKSAINTAIGILFLFSLSLYFTVLIPRHVDPTWTEPTNPYQVQMFEISDPNYYISNTSGNEPQHVYSLKNDFTLLAFQEHEQLRIVAPSELEQYITKHEDLIFKLTSRLMLLRKPEKEELIKKAETIQKDYDQQWEEQRKANKSLSNIKPVLEILELYLPEKTEAFALAPSDSRLENWVDKNFQILDSSPKQPYHSDPGVIYVLNPIEYRIKHFKFGQKDEWRYDPNGTPIENEQQLQADPLRFVSRHELIFEGEDIYAKEGCHYCHSDQTRTLVQDVVLNGSDSFPAPPSSANEYIYQKVTFMSTRRIGPDLSRVGIKRASRDWHKGHFWSPATASKGSIMPSFKHFFDFDPSGTSSGSSIGIPNYKFEAIYQYLMTKGTRITPPTQAWWLGKDPINTLEVIEGRKVLP